MRHVDHRQAALVAQAADLVQDAGLGHDVEARRRLVEHHHRRLADQRRGDGDPLLLAAGELVRVAAREGAVGRQVHALERLAHVLRRAAAQHLADLVGDAERGIERRAGVLGDVGDRTAAQPPQVALRPADQRVPVDDHLAPRDAGAGPA